MTCTHDCNQGRNCTCGNYRAVVWRRILLILILWWAFFFCLIAHADVIDSPETFAVCKAVDVATTIYLVNSGIATEANPIVAGTMGWGLGYLPLIAAGVGIYYLLKKINNPTATTAANVITCGAAVSNLVLLP